MSIVSLAIPTGAATLDLSGTVTDASGNALKGISVSLAVEKSSAQTDGNGIWRICSADAGISSVRLSLTTSPRRLQVIDGHLRLSLGGYDVRGRRLADLLQSSSLPLSAAARTSAVVDTLLYARNDTVLAREPLGSYTQQDIKEILTGNSVVGGTIWNPNITYGVLFDQRDSQSYRTVKVGSRTWMAQNLNYRNTVGKADTAGVCYGNSADSCRTYGRLYSWADAMGLGVTYNASRYSIGNTLTRGVCPAGWHVPSAAEWNQLVASKSSSVLKSASGWSSGNGTDSVGFRALPAGYKYRDGTFKLVGNEADFWTSNDTSSTSALCWSLYAASTPVLERVDYKTLYVSLRCVNDDTSSALEESPWNTSVAYGMFTDTRDSQVYKTVVIGKQTWMAQNLNYRSTTGVSDTVGVCYNASSDSCRKYGRLYTWSEARALAKAYDTSLAKDTGTLAQARQQGLCPSDWHIPSDSEWDSLQASEIGLKSLTGWDSSGSGADSLGFRALPAGYMYRDGTFKLVGAEADFWSATQDANVTAWCRSLYATGESTLLRRYDYKTVHFSLRCLKDD